MPRKRSSGFSGRLRSDGRPDARTKAGKAFYARSEAAKKGWETRRQKESGWEVDETEEYIVEEPIETVGGKRYGKKK